MYNQWVLTNTSMHETTTTIKIWNIFIIPPNYLVSFVHASLPPGQPDTDPVLPL